MLTPRRAGGLKLSLTLRIVRVIVMAIFVVAFLALYGRETQDTYFYGGMILCSGDYCLSIENRGTEKWHTQIWKKSKQSSDLQSTSITSRRPQKRQVSVLVHCADGPRRSSLKSQTYSTGQSNMSSPQSQTTLGQSTGVSSLVSSLTSGFSCMDVPLPSPNTPYSASWV